MITGYEVGLASLAPTSGNAYVNLWAPTRRLKVREIGVINTTTTALAFLELIRTSARGTQSTTVTPTAAANAQDTADLGPTALGDTAWSVQPTLAAIPLRELDIAGTVGSAVIWTWSQDGELIVPIGAGIALVNASGGTTGITRFYFVWGE